MSRGAAAALVGIALVVLLAARTRADVDAGPAAGATDAHAVDRPTNASSGSRDDGAAASPTATAGVDLVGETAGSAATDADLAGDAAFRAAMQLAAAGDVASALDALEALGRARPLSRWTDDAWVEAARLAERGGDYARARRDLAEAIAASAALGDRADARLRQRAQADLARLERIAGPAGEWGAVAAAHERLVAGIRDGGDPEAELRELEALARAHPRYPRRVDVRLALARGWEEEADVARAIRWLRDALALATGAERERARIELVRVLVRDRALAAARAELARLTDRAMRDVLAHELAIAERRATIRWIVAAFVAALLVLAAVVLRRRRGSWRAAARALARPPVEVVFLAPIGAVVALFATTGNPLVARAVLHIVLAGVALAWISGVLLEAAPRPLGTRRVLAHAAVVALAVLAIVYLVLDHDGLLDFITETWRTGPTPR